MSRDFEAFWPQYVRLHSRRGTQNLHVVATLVCAAMLLAALLTGTWWLAPLALLADHTIAQLAHRLYQKNATQPWRHPVWHARAELRMARLVLSGRRPRDSAGPAA